MDAGIIRDSKARLTHPNGGISSHITGTASSCLPAETSHCADSKTEIPPRMSHNALCCLFERATRQASRIKLGSSGAPSPYHIPPLCINTLLSARRSRFSCIKDHFPHLHHLHLQFLGFFPPALIAKRRCQITMLASVTDDWPRASLYESPSPA